MNRRIPCLVAIVALSGCARFSTRQIDESWTTPAGGTYRRITTRATSTAFFDSTSRLTRFHAQQTDKSQTASVGGLDSTSSGTNAVRVVEAVGTGVVHGLKTSLLPIP